MLNCRNSDIFGLNRNENKLSLEIEKIDNQNLETLLTAMLEIDCEMNRDVELILETIAQQQESK